MSDIQDSEASQPREPKPGSPAPELRPGAGAASQGQGSVPPVVPAAPIEPVAAPAAVTAAPLETASAVPPHPAQPAAQPHAIPHSPLPPPSHHSTEAPWAQTWNLLMARFRALSDKAGRRVMHRTLKIGVSARIFHPESGAKGLRSKTLQYLEESIAQWVMSRDVLVFMIPTVNTNGLVHPSNIRLRDYAKNLDGLVLQGGADVSPQSYAQAATRPEWSGDRVRDMYELELLHEFIEAGKPVLGICRGCQLINVAFGGTLYQDIATDVPTAIPHVNDMYDSNYHELAFPPGSTLAQLVSTERAIVNSIHHQAVRDVGRDLSVEAVSGPDQIVEAIRYRKAPFVMGLQWHPEFHRAGGAELLDCTPILDSFLRAARETRF
ncbi:gamma-glutamyl-gamma-aminobutyrate hydrolase [Herbaspirillum sp. YR522]|uniref:gamma-glutamyl-gamma-aminobutyrate hydrolase n=1 Tax=Herbaspirillum sp. YR522 TaxID=1144342 RepID=UPI00026FA230|nr:gamma-glutamyl-gamma-aminobutyrate hydrolase [Herbaspirillum sp. YR522]EJN09780.1 putative glutamine amidotransferase [Herbaspirillum sp. YR522]